MSNYSRLSLFLNFNSKIIIDTFDWGGFEISVNILRNKKRYDVRRVTIIIFASLKPHKSNYFNYVSFDC